MSDFLDPLLLHVTLFAGLCFMMFLNFKKLGIEEKKMLWEWVQVWFYFLCSAFILVGSVCMFGVLYLYVKYRL